MIFSLGGFLAYQIYQNSIYDKFSDTQKIQSWIIENTKNKNFGNIKMVYCLEPTMDSSTLNSSFESFWNGLTTEDWSKVELKNPESNKNQNYSFVIKNIINSDGETGSRYFVLQTRARNRGFPILVQIFPQEYICFEPNSFVIQKSSFEIENPKPFLDK